MNLNDSYLQYKNDPRYIHIRLILKFLKFTKLLSDEAIQLLADDIGMGKIPAIVPIKIVNPPNANL